MGRPAGIPTARLHKWTLEQTAFMAEFVPGHSHAEIKAAVNERFSLSLTDHQVKGYISRHKLNTGRTGRFIKGQVSHNKGKTGYYAPGSEKGWFKSGNFAWDRVPIGTERIAKDGYPEVKTRDGFGVRNWRGKHLVTWEAVNGPIPPGHCVIFIDGDKTNGEPDNLILIERAILARLNQGHMPRGTREQVEASIALARLQLGIADAKRRQKRQRRAVA